ncbi:MAG: diguanylate cyclase [Gemmatimonadetes bacterium]|nr:diguanylate cyclase [Gemmatimonadota bacterium]
MTVTARLLVAEEDAAELRVLCWLLRSRGFDVVGVSGPHEARSALAGIAPDLVLVDFAAMPGAREELVELFQQDSKLRDVPVLELEHPIDVASLLGRLEAYAALAREVRELRTRLRAREAELERLRQEAASGRQLVDIVHDVSGEPQAPEIYRILARRVARALGISHCSVVLASAEDTRGMVAAAFEDPSVQDMPVELERYPEITAALRTGQPVLVEDAASDPLFEDARRLWSEEHRTVRIRSVLVLPFALDRWRTGVLFLRTERDERTLDRADVAFAETVVRATASALKRAQALEATRADNKRLEALATTDSLTRLLNRRALTDRLAAELDRARRFEFPITCLVADIDFFKDINDQRGHLAGDEVLRQFAELLASAARTIDIVARYGGEEFVVLLPETAPDGGMIFAERMRERISHHVFALAEGGPVHLTASIGVASFPNPRVESAEDLFARADEALYRAKSGGRNQVCI